MEKHPWGVLLLVHLPAEACNFLTVTLLHECFLHFLNWRNGTKSLKASQSNPIKTYAEKEKETSQLIYLAYQFPGFHMRGTVVINGFMILTDQGKVKQ